MRRFLLFFSYIGTGFRGIQRLVPRHMKTNLTTPAVTEVIEDALKRRLNLEKLPILHTASRTDAGVHALRSAASFDLDLPNLPPDAITVALNHYFYNINCPIRILSTQVVKPDFRTRSLPLARSYLYRFAVQKADSGLESDFSFTHLVPTPIQEYKRCHFVHDSEFNADAVRSVLPLFEGCKDFASFMSKSTGPRYEAPPPTTIRRLDSVTLEPGHPLMPGYSCDQYFNYWQVKVVGKSFLYKQVRRTVAVLLGVGQGKLDYAGVESLFTNPGTWPNGIRSVPPYGLYLTDVVYSKEDLAPPVSAEEGDDKEALVEDASEEVKVDSVSSCQAVKEGSDQKVENDLSKVKVNAESASPKDTAGLSIIEKINLRQSKLKLEKRREAEKNRKTKLSTRHAVWLAQSNYAKGLK